MVKLKSILTSRPDWIVTVVFQHPDAKKSCKEVTDAVIERERITDEHTLRYISGSISTVLNKLVKEGKLKYAEEKTSRGGHIYQKV